MITSLHNPRIQAVRKLQSQGKTRREQGAFIIEGVRLAEEALQRNWASHLVLYTDELDQRGKQVVGGFINRGVPAEEVSNSVMSSISETDTPQGLLAVLELSRLSLPPEPGFVLILDGLRDPGNLGAILRSAAAAGVEAVLLAQGCADAWSPKVVRAAMGAHFHLPIHSLTWPAIESIVRRHEKPMTVYLADVSGGLVYTQADFCKPLALIIGGEAAGAGSTAASLAEARVHIPMPGGSESLNAAIAASLLVFEVVRQRGLDNRK